MSEEEKIDLSLYFTGLRGGDEIGIFAWVLYLQDDRLIQQYTACIGDTRPLTASLAGLYNGAIYIMNQISPDECTLTVKTESSELILALKAGDLSITETDAERNWFRESLRMLEKYHVKWRFIAIEKNEGPVNLAIAKYRQYAERHNQFLSEMQDIVDGFPGGADASGD